MSERVLPGDRWGGQGPEGQGLMTWGARKSSLDQDGVRVSTDRV